MKRHPEIKGETGFTLVELLGVLAVMAVLIAMTTYGLRGVMSARNVARAGAMMSEQLGLARQMAASHNTRVAWQVLRVARNPGDQPAYRCVRIQKFNPRSREWETAGAAEWLPMSVGVDERVDQSPLLANAVTTLSEVSLGGKTLQGVSAIEVIFLPNGSTSLNPNGVYFLTLRDLNPGGEAVSRLVTLQIHPLTGRSNLLTP